MMSMNHRRQIAQAEIQIDGKSSSIEMLDIDTDEDELTVKYDKGTAIIGFDFDEEEPEN